ncbi:hypothetical protein Trydic_g18908 [Trypoxylus dichotomus]
MWLLVCRNPFNKSLYYDVLFSGDFDVVSDPWNHCCSYYTHYCQKPKNIINICRSVYGNTRVDSLKLEVVAVLRAGVLISHFYETLRRDILHLNERKKSPCYANRTELRWRKTVFALWRFT